MPRLLYVSLSRSRTSVGEEVVFFFLQVLSTTRYLSRVVRKSAFSICENKDADQLRAFVFATRIVQSFYFLNPKFQACSCTAWFVSYLVGNQKTGFLTTRLILLFLIEGRFLFPWQLRKCCVISLWHSLGLPYNFVVLLNQI